MLRPKLNRIWAGNSAPLRRDPGDTKYIQGWISEIPTYQVLNYLQYKIDTTLLAQAERGIFEWGTDVQYGLGSVAWDELDKTIYVSIVGSPDRTKAPSQNTSQWRKSAIQVPRNEYDAIVAAINTHIADITGNPHQLTAGRLNAYNKAETDNLVTQYRALVSAHASDTNNPHQLTATQVGAVPVAGGTYTGDVIFNAGLFFDTGKTKELYKTGGLYLRNSTGVVGISDTGVPEAGTTTSKSPIVLEKDFADFKKQNEPDYAVPQPYFHVPFIGDMNVAIGPPITIGSDNVPDTFASDGGRYFGEVVGQSQNVPMSDAIGVGAIGATLSADVFYETAIAGNTTPWGINIGVSSSNIKLYLRDNMTFYGQAGGQNTATIGPIEVGKWARLVVVFESNYVAIYLNGVLGNRSNKSTPIPPLGGNQSLIQESSNTSVNKPKCRVKNIRLWTTALTPEQISRL